MDSNELRRHAVLCERLAQGAIPFSVSEELMRLADEFETEALARMFNESLGRRFAARQSGH
jgi:hypothetical protein